jgi:small membrane protein
MSYGGHRLRRSVSKKSAHPIVIACKTKLFFLPIQLSGTADLWQVAEFLERPADRGPVVSREDGWMTLFQWFMLPALASVFFWEMVGLARHPTGRRLRLVRGAVWAIAALAIAKPEFLQAVANLIGISRGADLVLYVFVLAFLGVSFYFDSRNFRLQGQLAEVVRHLAIQNARHGGDADLDGSPLPSRNRQ